MTGWESSRIIRRQLMEEHEQALELETMRLSQLRITHKHLASQSCMGYPLDELKPPEGFYLFIIFFFVFPFTSTTCELIKIIFFGHSV